MNRKYFMCVVEKQHTNITNITNIRSSKAKICKYNEIETRVRIKISSCARMMTIDRYSRLKFTRDRFKKTMMKHTLSLLENK